MMVIQCNILSKKFGHSEVLKGLSFSIEENKITGLIGRNGAGKTTLLKLMAGFSQPSSGEITVFSEIPFNNLKVSQNMIFIDDNMVLPQSLNLAETLEAVGQFYPNWDNQLANRLFNYFSFNPKQRHQNLSKGMKSTFNMIIGLVARCPLTIFDEPTTGMDAAIRKDFYRALLKDYLDHPRTIVLSSHLLSEIDELLEDVILIKNGEKHLHMSVEELNQLAIGLSGKTQLVEEWTERKNVLYRKTVGVDSSYVVVENDFSEDEIKKMNVNGIERSAVSSEDVCVYLTNTTKGGIDDVFTRS